MTTDLARSILDELDQFTDDIPGAINLEPGRLSWLHGTKGRSLDPGVFYAKNTAFTCPPPDGVWAIDERYADQGETGYSAPQLRIAFLGQRDQWFRPGAEKGDAPTWLQAYEAGAKKLTEHLVLVEGINDPMVLSASGMYKARPIEDIISAYRRGTLMQAMRQVRRSLPLWTHWLTIANQRDASGKPLYVNAKDASGKEFGSVVTPPAQAAPPTPLSSDVFRHAIEVFQEFSAQGWFKFRRVQRGTIDADYVISAAPPPLALPAGHNIPQPIESDDDLPF